MDKTLKILVDFDYTLFDTAKLVKYLSTSPKIVNYKDFLYPDAMEFINYASSFGDLILFSEGEVEFQKEKIEGTEIGKLFSGGVKIFPSYSKMQNLNMNGSGQKMVLIDDKPDVIDEAISRGYIVLRVKRGKHSTEKTKTKPNYVVNNLSKIISKDILRSI